MVLMFMMVAGLVVLNESSLYNWSELVLLYGSAGFVIAGIFVLTQKQNIVVVEDQESRLERGESQTFFVSSHVEMAQSELLLSQKSHTEQLLEHDK